VVSRPACKRGLKHPAVVSLFLLFVAADDPAQAVQPSWEAPLSLRKVHSLLKNQVAPNSIHSLSPVNPELGNDRYQTIQASVDYWAERRRR
jgi:hypothetical protein